MVIVGSRQLRSRRYAGSLRTSWLRRHSSLWYRMLADRCHSHKTNVPKLTISYLSWSPVTSYGILQVVRAMEVSAGIITQKEHFKSSMDNFDKNCHACYLLRGKYSVLMVSCQRLGCFATPLSENLVRTPHAVWVVA